jgi:ectoine hydroxylase-related dioxygenase (phytanoyl-CoA dioxygenase family)
MAEQIREFLAAENLNDEHPSGFQPLKWAGAFAAIGESSIPIALDDLFGTEGWERPRYWGQPLVTNRVSRQPWDVSTDSWHIHRRSDTGALHRINFFVVLSRLRPQGGGTLMLTGSHRLIGQFGDAGAKSKALRRSLGKRHPWLADLWGPAPQTQPNRRKRYLMDGVVIDGIPMRVVEVTGEPGDAYLMRTDTFHARSPNTFNEPRIMLAGGISVQAQRPGATNTQNSFSSGSCRTVQR